MTSEAIAKLTALLGDDRVVTDLSEREWYSADFTDDQQAVPAVVVQPKSTEDVVEIVRIATSADMAVVARGGGMSYTLAHTTTRADSVMLDMRDMNRIIDVNVADRYVTVEPGVTWAQLRRALAGTGMRVPFLGTLSGLHATVGGGLSQQATGLGEGCLTDCVLGLEVVLGDGRVLRTGSGAAEGTGPFLRNFGPDLSGLFLVDSGAFGFKTRATLRLDPVPGGVAFGCFAFADCRAMVDAEVELSRLGLVTECVGWDGYFNDVMADAPAPPRADAIALAKDVLRLSKSRWRNVRTLLRAARPGLGFLRGVPFSLVVVSESSDQAAADRLMAQVGREVSRHRGRSLPTTLTMGMRMDPFQPIDRLMVGRNGESNFPSNALFPLSRAREAVDALEGFFADNAEVMREHGIFVVNNYLLASHYFGLEPILFWPDAVSPYRLSWTDPAQREQLRRLPANPEARAAVLDLRRRMIQMLRGIGTAHLQIGKTYPFREALEGQVAWDVLEQLKDLLDPTRAVNPGSLGLR